MLILQAFVLWLVVSTLMMGGALAFCRYFPKESPWLGFIVPPLAFVVLINFIEHIVALPSLLFALPLLVGGSLWLMALPSENKMNLLLPAVVFLGAFTFTFGIRCLEPDILYTSDGLADLNKINNYCQGDVLPPLDTWLPPYKYEWYYSLQHYAASIVKRLFDVRVGVAYNVSHALVSTLTCVAGAAAAHRISGGKIWITLAIPFLIESATTGSSAYLQLFVHDPSSWLANNLSGGVINYDQDLAKGALTPTDENPLWKWLAQAPYRERLELQVPGFWTWRDEFHANSSGHFLTLLSVLIVMDLICVSRTVWPWLMAVFTPILAVVSSTWAFPITFLLCGGGTVIALIAGRRPAQPGMMFLMLFIGLTLLWPSFYNVTSSPEAPDIMWTDSKWRVGWREFLVQWWPIIVLWICGWFCFRRMSWGVRWIMLVIPLMLIGIEIVTVEGRYNTVEKMWGYTYGTGLIALFPVVATQANLDFWLLNRIIGVVLWLFSYIALDGWLKEKWKWVPWEGIAKRANVGCMIITLVILLSSAISMSGWLRTTWRWAPWGDGIFHLEGSRYITRDDQKRKMIEVLAQVKHATFLSGKSDWCYYESPALAVFTENRSYLAWWYFESVADYADEAQYRNKQNNDFYSGAMTNRLKFLQDNNITGVLIWPDDNIPDDFLNNLITELAPSYDYIDCKGNGDKAAGVFILRPLPVK